MLTLPFEEHQEGAPAQFAEWAPGGQVLSCPFISCLLNTVFNTGVMDRWVDKFRKSTTGKLILYDFIGSETSKQDQIKAFIIEETRRETD